MDVHQGKAGRIPELVYEVPVSLNPFFRHLDVPALGGERRKGKTKGVCAILIHDG